MAEVFYIAKKFYLRFSGPNPNGKRSFNSISITPPLPSGIIIRNVSRGVTDFLLSRAVPVLVKAHL